MPNFNMATVKSQAVFTNSCVRTPMISETRPTSSLSRRPEVKSLDPSARNGNQSTENARQAAPVQNGMAGQSSVNGKSEGTSPFLSDLSDETFYKKLLALKEENKKILARCEQIYQDKLTGRSGQSTPPPAQSSNGIPVATVTGDFMLTTTPKPDRGPKKEREDTLNCSIDGFRGSTISKDHVRDMSASKPPRPKTVFAAGTGNSGKKPGHVGTSKSMDDRYWKLLSASSDSEISDDEAKNTKLSKSENFVKKVDFEEARTAAEARIDEMWENFSIENYAPARPRSASLTQTPKPAKKDENKKEKQKEWRHRITIPKPFSMTIRESNKDKAKSRTLEEYEKLKEEQERRAEIECQKKFKAKPVPAHVYMPLFDEILEEKETRRRFVKENREKILKSIEQPFKFSQRETEKTHKRTKSAPLTVKDENKNQGFKAKPFPSHIFEEGVTDRFEEEEEYRKIRIQMRAEELFHSASLPPTMKARSEEYTEGKKRQKMYADRANKAHMTIEHKFKPRINDGVPDFEELHRQFMKDIETKKTKKEATVVKPFNLQSARIPSKKHKVYDDIERDEQTLKESRWPFKTPRRRQLSRQLSGSLSVSLDSIPAKMTQSADMRNSANRDRLRRMIQKEMDDVDKAKRRKNKEKELRKKVTERAAANDKSKSLKETSAERLKQHRVAERARMEEYRKELDEIMNRVSSRPLLFERTSQMSAKQKAEKKYLATLQRSGLDEEFVQSRGSMSAGLDDPTGYEEIDEQSHTGGQYSEDFDEQFSDDNRTPEDTYEIINDQKDVDMV